MKIVDILKGALVTPDLTRVKQFSKPRLLKVLTVSNTIEFSILFGERRGECPICFIVGLSFIMKICPELSQYF